MCQPQGTQFRAAEDCRAVGAHAGAPVDSGGAFKAQGEQKRVRRGGKTVKGFPDGAVAAEQRCTVPVAPVQTVILLIQCRAGQLPVGGKGGYRPGIHPVFRLRRQRKGVTADFRGLPCGDLRGGKDPVDAVDGKPVFQFLRLLSSGAGQCAGIRVCLPGCDQIQNHTVLLLPGISVLFPPGRLRRRRQICVEHGVSRLHPETEKVIHGKHCHGVQYIARHRSHILRDGQGNARKRQKQIQIGQHRAYRAQREIPPVAQIHPKQRHTTAPHPLYAVAHGADGAGAVFPEDLIGGKAQSVENRDPACDKQHAHQNIHGRHRFQQCLRLLRGDGL